MGARSMKRAIEIVCVQVKDIGRLTYQNVRGHRASFVWQGDMTRALDVSVCVCGRGWGRGRQRPNYRGRTTRICVEKERPSYVLREIGRHPYITEGREIGWDGEREGREKGSERGRVMHG